MPDGTLKFDTSLDSGGLQSGMGKLGSIAQNALGVFTGNLMTKATEAVVNLGKEALNSGMSFEASMAKTKTLFTGTDEEFAALSDELLRISSATGLAADGLAEAAYSAESASVPAEMLGAMIEKSAKLATAGFTDIDTALSATAKTMNAYGMEGEEAIDKVQKVLMQTQNLGITTVDELGASLAQVTPTAASFGVSFEQVGASLAVMTAQGTPTAQATTQLNALIAELGKNGTTAAKNLEEAAKGTEYAGMTFTQMMESGADLNTVLGMMSDHADKNGLSMVDMFSSIEAGKAALAITSNEGETFTANLAAMSTEADVVGDAFATVSDTLEFKTQRIQTSFSNMATSLYQTAAGPLADAAESAADAIGTITDAFNEGGVEGVADALLTMLENAAAEIEAFDWEGAADSIVEGITSFIEGDGLGRFLDAASNIISSIAAGLGKALPKLLPALAKLVAYILVSLIKRAPKLLEAGLQLIADLILGLVQAIPDVAVAIWQVVQAILDAIGQLPGILQGYYDTLIDGITTWLSDMWTKASEGMSQFVNTIVEWASQIPGQVWTWLTNAANKVMEWAAPLVANATAAVSGLVNTVVQWFSQLPAKIWTWLVNVVTKITQWGLQLVQKGTAAAQGLVNAVLEGVRSLPEKMAAVGSDIVTGLWNGIANGWSWLTNMISQKAKELLEAAKSAIKVGSPSRSFRDEMGRWIPPGIGEGVDLAMPDLLDDMRAHARRLVAVMQGEVAASASDIQVGASGAAALRLGSTGTTVYQDNHVEQYNEYHVPVASPSETSKAQREALRNFLGGVK